MASETHQSDNIVGGHQAGRDVIVQSSGSPGTTMACLVRKFREEVESDRTLKEFIESLAFYTTSVDQEARSLEEKLVEADREDDILQALELKELFSKKLHRHQLSPAAQEIFAFILGFVHSMYLAKIRPYLGEHTTAELDAMLIEGVIEPAVEKLEENVLIINYQELRGSVYYLTGTCHLSWTS